MTGLAEKSEKTFKKWASHFDEDNWTWYFNHCYQTIYDLIGQEIHSESNILDIGCGTGGLIRKVCQLNKKGKITGVESVAEMAERARERNVNNSNVEIINTSIESFQAIDQYNIVFCVNVFHHLENPKEILTKIRSLLASDGLFVYLDPFRDNIIRLAWEYLSKYLFFREPYIKYYQKNELFQLFEETGYNISKVKEILYVILVCVLKKNEHV
ncbi:MAG: class I SAM-dependent methyltransferase [Parcubacteria group bacterium]